MNRLGYILILATSLLLLIMPSLVQALAVNIENNGRAIFAGERTPYSISLTAQPKSLVEVSWKLTSLGRTLSSGIESIRLSTHTTIKSDLPLSTPPVKPGVKVNAQLIIDVTYRAEATLNEHYEFALDIYGADILLADQHIYKQLNIQLFDPVGQTSNIFDKLKIPYSTLSRSKLINLSDKGLIVIGSSVDINQYRGLSTILLELASKGHQLLILQPTTVTFPLTELISNLGSSPASISFSNKSAVHNNIYDYQWNMLSAIKSHQIILQSNRQEISAHVIESKHDGWDWFNLNYSQSQGRVTVCMLPFIEKLDTDPIKQIIFGQLLNFAGNQPAFEEIHN